MEGLWQLAYDRLVRTLRQEGLLDESRKRPIPAVPDRIGIVTSAQSAALHDMHRALRPQGVVGDGVRVALLGGGRGRGA
jgi:exonuclease VII large subunit